LNNFTHGENYAIHGTVQNTLAKAMNGNVIKAYIVEAHPYGMESTRTDILVSSAEKPGENLYHVNTTIINDQHTSIPKLIRLTAYYDILCLNKTAINNHILSATNINRLK
jgi:hypothetical protein